MNRTWITSATVLSATLLAIARAGAVDQLPTPTTTGVPAVANDTSFGDLNGDGFTDVVVAGQAYFGATGAYPTTANTFNFNLPLERVDIVKDVNHDGLDDFVELGSAVAGYTGNALTIELCTSLTATGSFIGGTPILTTQYGTNFSQVANIPTNTNFGTEHAVNDRAFTIDINRDGLPDLVVLANDDSGLGHALFFLQQSNGTFNTTPDYDISFGNDSFTAFAIGDYDGDGNPDLLVATGYYSGSNVWAFTASTGFNGTYTAVLPSQPINATIDSLSVGDLNGDGAPDVVVNEYDGSNTWELFYGNESGFPAEQDSTAAGTAAILPHQMSTTGTGPGLLWLNDGTNSGLCLGQPDATGPAIASSYAIDRIDPSNTVNNGDDFALLPDLVDIDNNGYLDLILVDQSTNGYANLLYFPDRPQVQVTAASLIAGFPATNLFSSATITDEANVTGAVISLVNPPDGANEVLNIALSASSPITAVVTPWNATSLSTSVTLSGADTAADYSAAIAAITYQDLLANGTAGPRTGMSQVTDLEFVGGGSGTFNVALDQAPIAPSATFAAPAGGPALANVGASDPDNGPQPLAYQIVTPALHGNATIDQSGNFTYISDGTLGVDSSVYSVTDGVLTATGTITVLVQPPLPNSRDTGLPVAYDDFSTGDVTGGGTIAMMANNLLYPGIANGTPDPATGVDPIGEGGHEQIVPDLNGDGMDDFVVLNTAYDGYSGYYLTVDVHASNAGADGGSIFSTSYSITTISSLSNSVAFDPTPFLARAFSIDINNDGLPDLVVVVNDDNGNGHVLVWLQQSKGTFNNTPDYDFTGDYITAATVGPADNTGLKDLIIARGYQYSAQPAVFTPAVIKNVTGVPEQSYGFLQYLPSGSGFTGQVDSFANDWGTGSLTDYGVFTSVSVGDLDNDGWPDVVANIYDNSTQALSWELVYGAATYTGGNGLYGTGQAFILPSFDANPQADLWLDQYGASGITTGILDVAGVQATPDQYHISRPDPDNEAAHGYTLEPIATDIDNDGYPDLILASSNYGSTLRIFPHTPSTPGAPYATSAVGGDVPTPMVPGFGVNDNAALQSASIRIDSPDPANTVIAADTTGTNLVADMSTVSDESGTHFTVGISGIGTNDDFAQVIDGITFQDTALVPSGPSATVAITVDDGIFATNAKATVNLITDQAPIANGGSLSLANGATATGAAIATDPDGLPHPLAYSIATDPTLGSVTIDPTSGVYTFSATAAGSDSFVYAVTDGVLSATATISVAIDSVPVAQSATAAINAGGTVTGTLVATDADNGPQPLQYAISTQPAHGILTLINASTGAYSYVNDGTAGTDSFAFTAFDGEATSPAATVTIAVNAPPVIPAQTFQILPGTTGTGNLVATDSDGPQPLVYAILGNPEQGTVTLLDATTGAFSYQANLSATGSDSFAFTVSDGMATTTGSVLVTYKADQAPVAQNQSISATSGATVTGSLLGSDSDGPQALVYAISAQPAHGTVTLLNAATGAFSLAANNNAVGTDTFLFTVSDGLITSTGVVTITYNSSGPQPLTALIGGQAPQPGQPYAAALGQAIDLFAINGKSPYTITSSQAVALPDTNLITNTDLNGDGRPDSGQHITLIPILPGTGSVLITDSAGATVAVAFTATALPSVVVAPPPVALSPAGSTIYTAICPGTEQGLANFEAALAGHDNTQVAAFAWNPAAQAFQPVTSTSTGLLPSQAIFLATRVDLGLDFSGDQAPVPYAIPLQPGWNFVGVPPLQSASATAPLLDHDLNADFTLTDTAGDVISGSQRDAAMGTAAYLWDGTTYDNETVLHTGQGYWIKNNTTAPGQTLLLKRVATGTGQRAVAKSVTFNTVDLGTPPTPPGNGADSATNPEEGGSGGCGLGSGAAAAVFLAALAFLRGGFLKGGARSDPRRHDRS
jgi:hypothetical protein